MLLLSLAPILCLGLIALCVLLASACMLVILASIEQRMDEEQEDL